MSEQEEWKDVVGYEDFFRVSNLGNVFSKRTNRLLKLEISPTGYLVFSTKFGGRNGTCKLFRVHRLVAEAFIENPDHKPYVNHRNGIKSDNQVSNLEWVTHSENIRHAFDNGLINSAKGIAAGNNKLSEDDVISIRREYLENRTPYRELARRFGVKHVAVGQLLRRETWVHLP
jgi:hypothetical protein